MVLWTGGMRGIAVVRGTQHRSFADGPQPDQSVPTNGNKLDSLTLLSDYPAKPCGAGGMDVGEWLRDLGLGEYEEKFRDNRIGADVLPRLTADDLKDIGVSAVGDRGGSSTRSARWP
jgi:SAM domain (Sterile alpha motif)